MSEYQTYGVHYLGSKRKIVPHILGITKKILPRGSKVIDVFTGSGRVAQAFKQSGYLTYTGDLNDASRVYSNAFVHTNPLLYLQRHIDKMNEVVVPEDYDGWLTKNYSGEGNVDAERELHRYIKPHNALKADWARDYVESLFEAQELNQYERDVLICSIIFAMNKVDNSVGQQHAYLKEWNGRSNNNISFQLINTFDGLTGGHHIHGDCFKVDYPKADLAYLDPPYTPTVPYHEYYHIWDSLTKWDKPQTLLKARRRIDRVKRNNKENYDESYRNIPWYDIKNQDNIEQNGAYQSFEKMVNKLDVKYVMISYSNESIVSKDQMLSLLEKYGEVNIIEIDHKRNIMGAIGFSKAGERVIKHNPNVTEYIFLLEKK
mgnify:CR=1 FL=1|jgi:adenine-specific DNA-methyltransferase|tara:strand:- start:81 stop:1202 length:1122 start_codon:yes stop_codon:yes gene_type:complete